MGGVFGFTEGTWEPQRRGAQPLGATPSPALLLPQARSSQQHLDGCSGTWGTGRGAGPEQGWGRKEKRWSLSSGCSQLQRTEGYTKQARPPPHTCSPLLDVHKLHSTCPWFGTKCTATGTEVGTRCPSSPKWGWELPGEKGYSNGFSLPRQLRPHLVMCGSQFTGAPSWHLFPTPLSEGRLGSLEATAVGVFTPWKLASAFLFPPGEPATEH